MSGTKNKKNIQRPDKEHKTQQTLHTPNYIKINNVHGYDASTNSALGRDAYTNSALGRDDYTNRAYGRDDYTNSVDCRELSEVKALSETLSAMQSMRRIKPVSSRTIHPIDSDTISHLIRQRFNPNIEKDCETKFINLNQSNFENPTLNQFQSDGSIHKSTAVVLDELVEFFRDHEIVTPTKSRVSWKTISRYHDLSVMRRRAKILKQLSRTGASGTKRRISKRVFTKEILPFNTDHRNSTSIIKMSNHRPLPSSDVFAEENAKKSDVIICEIENNKISNKPEPKGNVEVVQPPEDTAVLDLSTVPETDINPVTICTSTEESKETGPQMDIPSSSMDTVDMICRICHGGESLSQELGKLVSACSCRGTVGLQHVRCLERWLTESGKSCCELCGAEYCTRRERRYGLARSLFVWAMTQNPKQLLVDALIITLMSPMAVLAAWLGTRSLAGLMAAGADDPLGAVVDWPLASTLVVAFFMLVCYYCCVLSAATRHSLGWWTWYHSQYDVRLLETSDRI